MRSLIISDMTKIARILTKPLRQIHPKKQAKSMETAIAVATSASIIAFNCINHKKRMRYLRKITKIYRQNSLNSKSMWRRSKIAISRFGKKLSEKRRRKEKRRKEKRRKIDLNVICARWISEWNVKWKVISNYMWLLVIKNVIFVKRSSHQMNSNGICVKLWFPASNVNTAEVHSMRQFNYDSIWKANIRMIKLCIDAENAFDTSEWKYWEIFMKNSIGNERHLFVIFVQKALVVEWILKVIWPYIQRKVCNIFDSIFRALVN